MDLKTFLLSALMLTWGYACAQDTVVIKKKESLKTSLSDNPNQLLFILDGVTLPEITKEKSGQFSVEDIDPSDIESVQVLKSDQATDKYGEEGKYGVIIITTKDPKKYQKKKF